MNKKCYQSIYNTVINNNELPQVETFELHDDLFQLPKDSFVLCRDKVGNTTATFGDMKWDFSPYNTTKENDYSYKFNFFETSSNLSKEHQNKLVLQIKIILFLLIYFLPDMGRSGSLSVKVLGKRFQILKSIALFSENIKNNFIIGDITIADILSNDNYMAAYILTLSENKRTELSHLLTNLRRINKNYLGFDVVSYIHCRTKTDQTSIIPSRIYFNSFHNLSSEITIFHNVKDSLYKIIKLFKNKNVGKSISTQKKSGVINNFFPTVPELLVKYGLNKIFIDKYRVSNIKDFVRQLTNIQLTCKHYIHLYTAMRHNEVLSLMFHCLQNKKLSNNEEVTSNSDLLDEKIIEIISITSKLTGYPESTSWLAPADIHKAIEILQAISKGMAFLYNTSVEKLPLFQSTAFIYKKDSKIGSMIASDGLNPICLKDMIITKNDRNELINSDADRDFKEKHFQVGAEWKFHTHQYRRSLGFFGANSNLISESTGMQLFKHLNNDMQRYYRRGYNKIRTILGHFNKEKNEFELPKDHFLFEFQTGVSVEEARNIIDILFNKEDVLLGKKGSYISKQTEKNRDNKINIVAEQKETEKKVHQGEIAYKKTLLGGCMKTSRCDDFMLGNFTSCINCQDAVIKKSNLDSIINDLKIELQEYDINSAEYQLSKAELDKLVIFRKNKISDMEIK